MSHVLLVDDNPLFRLGLREVIKSAQPELSVIECETLLGARAILREKQNVALVILEIKVHDCGGFFGLFELRREFPSIPVVICSSSVDSESVSRAVAFGAAGYISKSAPCDVIARMLKTSLVGNWTTGPIIANENQVNPIAALTPAQVRVLKGLKRGLDNKHIASELGLSEKTIKAYMSVLYRKLGLASRADAIILLQKVALDFPAVEEIVGNAPPPAL